MGPQLTLDLARAMQDELMEQFITEEFQKELRDVWDAAGGKVHKKEVARRELCLKYQLPVIVKYGFPASFEGVLQSYTSYPHIDPEMIHKDMLCKWLINPELQARGPLPGHQEGALLAAAVMQMRDEIARAYGRKLPRPVPIRGGRAATTQSYLVDVPLPWIGGRKIPVPLECAVLHGVLSVHEVDRLRTWVEERAAGPGWYPHQDHLVHRAAEEAEPLARELWLRVERFLPATCGDKAAAGLSDHNRFLKYGPGHFFLPHRDGMQTTALADGSCKRSLLSAILYLSDPEDGLGGNTRFVAPDCAAYLQSGRCEGACARCVDPPLRKGSMLFFAQDIMHAGTGTREAEKFVLRTDVLYHDAIAKT